MTDDGRVPRSLLEAIRRRLGLRFADEERASLARRLEPRLRLRAVDLVGYARLLEDERASAAEIPALADLLTVGESWLMRGPEQLRAVVRRAAAIHEREGRRAAIWCAGGAAGEEPASLAILALEEGLGPSTIAILSTDASPARVAAARDACFPERAMREVAPPLRARHFDLRGDRHALRPAPRALVRLAVHNLLDPPPSSLASADVVVCRNVLMYLDREARAVVLGRFRRLLPPAGLLVLGASELAEPWSTEFALAEIDGALVHVAR